MSFSAALIVPWAHGLPTQVEMGWNGRPFLAGKTCPGYRLRCVGSPGRVCSASAETRCWGRPSSPKIDPDGGILHTQPVAVRREKRAWSIGVESDPGERSLAH